MIIIRVIHIRRIVLMCLLVEAISSCIKTEVDDRYEILSNCGSVDTFNFACSLELIQKTVQLNTNILGKTSEKTIKSKKLSNLLADDGNSSRFSCVGANFSSTQELQAANLPPCQGDDCNALSNPTGCTFPKGRLAEVSVSGLDVNTSTVISHNDDIETQYTMPVGKVVGFNSGRNSDMSGIVWELSKAADNATDESSITFTCPTGYAVPAGAIVAELGQSIEGTRARSSKVEGWRIRIISTGGPQRIESHRINDNKWVVKNISGFGLGQDTPNGGFIEFSCVKDSQVSGWTF